MQEMRAMFPSPQIVSPLAHYNAFTTAGARRGIAK
jgi:hypothetical protein